LDPVPLHRLRIDAQVHLNSFQALLALARETVPQATATEARRALTAAAHPLGLELVETGHVAPIFLLLPGRGSAPRVTLFATWHAEALPTVPAAVEGAERLALAATFAALHSVVPTGALGAAESPEVAVVAAPASSQGSLVIAEALREHRDRLRAPVALWPRIAPDAPRRRRVFLGARGRVVLGVWGDDVNPYAVRDSLVKALSTEAYGPRPLDFELLRKLAASPEAMGFLEETFADPDAAVGAGEERVRRALFDPSAQVLRPAVKHPDRPRAWITVETAEAMEPPDIHRRAVSLAGGARIEMADGFVWDRVGIHHPASQVMIRMAKSRSAGAEIWPMAPWFTPSGLYTRALGTPLTEWGVPLPAGMMLRFPKPDAFEAVAREIGELLLRATDALAAESPAAP
jgi:hypothetical protein